MKYFVDFIFVMVFAAICFFCLKVSKDYKHSERKMDSLENEFIRQQHKLDSLSIPEAVIIERKKTINNYYTNEATKIIYLSDSFNVLLLRSNLERFMYLHNPKGSKDSQFNGQ